MKRTACQRLLVTLALILAAGTPAMAEQSSALKAGAGVKSSPVIKTLPSIPPGSAKKAKESERKGTEKGTTSTGAHKAPGGTRFPARPLLPQAGSSQKGGKPAPAKPGKDSGARTGLAKPGSKQPIPGGGRPPISLPGGGFAGNKVPGGKGSPTGSLDAGGKRTLPTDRIRSLPVPGGFVEKPRDLRLGSPAGKPRDGGFTLKPQKPAHAKDRGFGPRFGQTPQSGQTGGFARNNKPSKAPSGGSGQYGGFGFGGGPSDPTDRFIGVGSGSDRSSRSGSVSSGSTTPGFSKPVITGGGRKPGRHNPYYDESRDVFVYPGGRVIQGSKEGVGTGRVQEDGSILYDDGTRVSHDSSTGTTYITHPDGRTSTLGRETDTKGYERPVWDEATGTYQYEDGTRIWGYDQSGRRGEIGDDNRIHFSDGSTIGRRPRSGTMVKEEPDGSSTTTTSDGTQIRYDAESDTAEVTTAEERQAAREQEQGEGGGYQPRYDSERDAYLYGEGDDEIGVPATGPDGSRGVVQEDGSILYADGTRARRSGSFLIIEKPDGSKITQHVGSGVRHNYNAQTGETTVTTREERERQNQGAQGEGSEDEDNSEGNEESDSGSDDDASENEDDSSSADDESDSSEDSDQGDGGSDSEDGSDDATDDDGGESSEYRGTGTGGRKSGVTRVVDDAVARKTGEKTPTENAYGCRPGIEGRTGPNYKPSGEDTGAPCPPVGLGRDEEEDRGQQTRDYIDAVDTRVQGTPLGPDCDERFMDCTGSAPIRENDPFDLSPVINPNPVN